MLPLYKLVWEEDTENGGIPLRIITIVPNNVTVETTHQVEEDLTNREMREDWGDVTDFWKVMASQNIPSLQDDVTAGYASSIGEINAASDLTELKLATVNMTKVAQEAFRIEQGDIPTG